MGCFVLDWIELACVVAWLRIAFRVVPVAMFDVVYELHPTTIDRV